MRADHLTRKSVKSCGCLNHLGHAARKHGAHGTPTYATWSSMIQRCSNPRDSHWQYYGGRGITVCDRWRTSFADFLADMGPKPAGYSIERADVDGNYEPSNCTWIPMADQSKNRRVATHCRRGLHLMTGSNLMWSKKSNGRVCRTCRACNTAAHAALREARC